MRHLALIIFLIVKLTTVDSQTTANLKKVSKTQGQASVDQKDINRLQTILTEHFLKRANNPKNKIDRQIQTFFADYRISKENSEHYFYPKQLSKSNLTISTTGYDYKWGLLSTSRDSSLFGGYRYKTLNAIISIPIYDAYHRGYSINSISFNCTFTEDITWTETSDNELPIEKLPTYKRQLNLTAKVLELDN